MPFVCLFVWIHDKLAILEEWLPLKTGIGRGEGD